MNYLVNFDALQWESPAPGIRHKLHRVDSRVLRLVEYSREMVPHWCIRGHIGHMVDGSGRGHFGGDGPFRRGRLRKLGAPG
jgi:hypothetical protein